MNRISHHTRSYPPRDYDDNLCLKPPLLLWFAVLYLSRAVVLPLVIGVGHVSGVNADAMTMLRGFWSAEELLPSIAALPVLYAMCRRASTASRGVRWVWAHGRGCLALSVGLDVTVKFLPLPWVIASHDRFIEVLVSTAVDAYFLAYVLAARRVRDTFLDFP